jgi:hypothetical protein
MVVASFTALPYNQSKDFSGTANYADKLGDDIIQIFLFY